MKHVAGFCLLIFASVQVFAQEQYELTYKEAIAIALENNVLLGQQQNNLSGIQANRSASYGSLAPDVNAFGQGWRNDGNFFIEQEARVVNTVSENIFGQINADILLFNGLSLLNTIKREEHNFNAQVMSIDRTRQDVIGDLTVQYLTVLQDQEQLKIANENLENQEVLLDQISAMFDEGSIPITDKYDQEFFVKNAELDVIRAQNTLKIDKALLAQVMLINPVTDFVLDEPSWNVEEIKITDYPVEDIFEISSVRIKFGRGQLKNKKIDLDVAYQSGNNLSFIVKASNRKLAKAFKPGVRMPMIQCYSPISVFNTRGFITDRKMIGYGPKCGDYLLDMMIDSSDAQN